MLSAHSGTVIPLRLLDDDRHLTDARISDRDSLDVLEDDASSVTRRPHVRRGSARDLDRQGAKAVVRTLCNSRLRRRGDLGWNLDYATAFCYRHLNGSRPDVIDVIDAARRLPVHPKTAFVIFNRLDQALFRNKLKYMVHLKWVSMKENSPGSTSVPCDDIPRICIRLNRTTFADGRADIDDMLDALIHQMIHAYFVVCCGPPPKDATADLRLLDGIHFAVILKTIDDISRCCRDGCLDLTFYARDRKQTSCAISGRRFRSTDATCRPSFISMDPSDSTIGLPPADGRSHCTHDNIRFTKAQIKNWQVVEYAKCIELGMEEKGDVVWDLNEEKELVEVDRLEGPPSITYVELLWDKYRIMAPRKKVLDFPSLRKPALKDEKYQIKVPECKVVVLTCLYDFLQHRFYGGKDCTRWTSSSDARQHGEGPPVLHESRRREDSQEVCLLAHVRVFKMAERLKFFELQEYVLARLWHMRATHDDPIKILTEVYNDDEQDRLISAKLRDWSRGFLQEDGHSRERQALEARPEVYRRRLKMGRTNYHKILHSHNEELKSMYYRNEAFKDDCNLVMYKLLHPDRLTDEQVLSSEHIGLRATDILGNRFYPRSTSRLTDVDLLDIERQRGKREPSPTISEAEDILQDLSFRQRRPPRVPYLPRRTLLDDVRPKLLPVSGIPGYEHVDCYTRRRYGISGEDARDRWRHLYALD